MRKFIVNYSLYSLYFGVFYTAFSLFAVPYLLEKSFGVNIEDQLRFSFKNSIERDYEILILGNSKIYCGINPDEFSDPAYNFAHNNDSYNQLYYKLLWLDSNKVSFQKLILGTDYFMFDIFSGTRNYVYKRYFNESYLKDYETEVSLYSQLKQKLRFLKPIKARRLLRFPYNKHEIKENGQFVRRGKSTPDDFIKRNFNFREVQIKYFDKIIEYSLENDIEVYIVLPPMRKNQVNQFSAAQKDSFRFFIQKRLRDDIHYLDFSVSHDFDYTDFVDFAHLDQEAATRFSRQLDSALYSAE